MAASNRMKRAIARAPIKRNLYQQLFESLTSSKGSQHGIYSIRSDGPNDFPHVAMYLFLRVAGEDDSVCLATSAREHLESRRTKRMHIKFSIGRPRQG